MKRTSFYLTVRDGVRLAVDLWLPARPAERSKLPAILHQTRYFRSVDWRRLPRIAGVDALIDIHFETRRAFLRAGYAWVDVDVRGSGASFGARPSPWWRDEVRDGAEVVDWIVGQPWSNGRVGSTGVSYSGTTAEMLLANRHPAVIAIMPRFSLFDAYTDVAFPGGVHLDWFTETWARFNAALDRNAFHEAIALLARINLQAARGLASNGDRRRLARLLGLADDPRCETWIARLLGAASRGVSRTDEDPRGETLRQAVASHHETDVHAKALAMAFRDDPGGVAPDPEAGIDAFSPHTYLADIRASGAAVYSVSGWLDGAYAHAAIKRHLNLPAGVSRLRLGPWDHGGRHHVRLEASARRSDFDHDSEMVGFFDHHLKGIDNAIMDGPPVRYFTLVEERWKTAPAWPPASDEAVWHAGPAGALVPAPPGDEGGETHEIDPHAGTGPRSRWRSLVGLAVPLGYGDRGRADERLVCFTSSVLPDDLEVTGHPVVHLFVRPEGPDGAFFAYLEDVSPSGRVTYVTEGMLRALHRRLSPDSSPYRLCVPARSFRRSDAWPMTAGETAELVFDLLPTSYLFLRGHALRVAIAGADRDHFAPVPGAARRFRIAWGPKHPTRIVLPVARRT